MAEECGLIEPFEPGQVREREGRKLVSYGTSSYGYDVRCADEFKIFTNINSVLGIGDFIIAPLIILLVLVLFKVIFKLIVTVLFAL